MDSNQLLFSIASGILINALVIYVAVSTAVQAKRRDKYQSQQINILIKIAMRQGVTDEEIEQALNS